MKTAYNTRYDNSAPASGFLVDFFESFPEDRHLSIVRRADDFAEKLASTEETTMVYDDMAAPLPSECERDEEPEMGYSNADVGEMWGG